MRRDLVRELITDQEDSLAEVLEGYGATRVNLSSPEDFTVVTTRSDSREYRVRFDARLFDLEPPKVYFCDDAGNSVQFADCPQGVNGLHNSHPNPDIQRPFFCTPGTYEYHLHGSHINDPWDQHRNSMPLAEIVRRVLRRIHGEAA